MAQVNTREQSIRIVSDGHGYNTKILLPDGSDITRFVRRVEWTMDPPDFLAEIKLTLAPCRVSADVLAQLKTLVTEDE